MESPYPGREIRTRDAIERTNVVVIASLVEPGVVSPGPPGAHDIDGARFRVERTLTPDGAPQVGREITVAYTRQVVPPARAEAQLERGRSYLLFANVLAPRRLYALKVVPHSDEAARLVASAFSGGARHAVRDTDARLA